MCNDSGTRVFKSAKQLRPDRLPSIGQRRSGIGQLQRCNQQITLTNTSNNSLPWIPGLLPIFLLPFRGRKQTTGFIKKLNPCTLSKSESAEIVCHFSDADRMCEMVKIHVAGLLNRIVEIHVSMAFTSPTTIRMAAPRQ